MPDQYHHQWREEKYHLLATTPVARAQHAAVPTKSGPLGPDPVKPAAPDADTASRGPATAAERSMAVHGRPRPPDAVHGQPPLAPALTGHRCPRQLPGAPPTRRRRRTTPAASAQRRPPPTHIDALPTRRPQIRPGRRRIRRLLASAAAKHRRGAPGRRAAAPAPSHRRGEGPRRRLHHDPRELPRGPLGRRRGRRGVGRAARRLGFGGCSVARVGATRASQSTLRVSEV
ncbi:unnamed protein product [Urochloa humidicola]